MSPCLKYFAGRGEHANQQMPAFPMAIRELHLAGVPNRGAHLEGSFGSRPRIHKTDVEAVRAALQTAIDVLPRDEVLAEIEKGHPLSRLAALTAGGGRLSASDLPLVLNFADDADPRTQQAALTALRHFGDSPAIEKLLAYARKNSEPTASIAIESLAASRYAAAHEGLLEVLQKEHPASRRLIVRILAKYPRPIWSDTIYSFVTDSEPEVAVEALRALVQVGHPRLFEVLKESLSRSSPVVRDEAFRLLSMRNDPQSEMLALDFALQTMQTGIPTPAMYDLLNRTKDARAIPVLLAQLDRSSRSRSQIIATLAQIGDQTVSEALVKRYSNFDNREKTAALNALQQLKSRSFRELAGEALKQSDAPLFAAAVSGLQNDGSPRAVELLVAALESSTNSTAWTNLTVAISSFGTPEAKAALNAARNAANPTKRELANTALQMLRRRSPGFSYCIQARQAVAIEKWDEAVARYTSAIEVDPDLPEAYSGRGHAYLQQKQTAKARKDFAKAIDLDAFSPEAVTGLGICLVQDGQIPQGIKVIEDSRARMNNDALYAYNAGCVYGRALQHLLKQPKSAERDKNAVHYQAKALADLRHSTKLGFTEFDWMKKDPDLESLHDVKEFKKIVSQEDSEEEAPEEKSSENGKADDKKTKARADAPTAEKATTVEAFKIDWLFENAQP